MSVSYTLYDKTTGKAVRNGIAPIKLIRKMRLDPNNFLYDGGAVRKGFWYDGSIPIPEVEEGSTDNPEDVRIVPRVDSGITIDRLTLTPGQVAKITSIPAGTVLNIDGTEITIPDGFLDFIPNTIGTYTIIFDQPPYLPVQFILEVDNP